MSPTTTSAPSLARRADRSSDFRTRARTSAFRSKHSSATPPAVLPAAPVTRILRFTFPSNFRRDDRRTIHLPIYAYADIVNAHLNVSALVAELASMRARIGTIPAGMARALRIMANLIQSQ